MARATAPNRGDVVWLDFDPQVGHEQAGHRPAVVLSHRSYNSKTGLAIVCPMTRQVDKGWPFTVKIDDSSGVIADQIKCLDWRGRRARVKGKVSQEVLDRVIATFSRLIMSTASP